MNGLKRGTIVKIKQIGDNQFTVSDSKEKVWYHADDEFHIYFKTALFHSDGTIIARYLGDTDGKTYEDFSFDLKYNPATRNWKAVDGANKIEAARLASVKNKKGAKVIIMEE